MTRSSDRPPNVVLASVLVLLAALPLAGVLGITRVGSWRMFTEPREYRLTLVTRDATGFPRRVTRDELAPHLGSDARRVVPMGGRFELDETPGELLEGGLDDLAELACALRPDAARAEARLERRRLDGAGLPAVWARRDCDGG